MSHKIVTVELQTNQDQTEDLVRTVEESSTLRPAGSAGQQIPTEKDYTHHTEEITMNAKTITYQFSDDVRLTQVQIGRLYETDRILAEASWFADNFVMFTRKYLTGESAEALQKFFQDGLGLPSFASQHLIQGVNQATELELEFEGTTLAEREYEFARYRYSRDNWFIFVFPMVSIQEYWISFWTVQGEVRVFHTLGPEHVRLIQEQQPSFMLRQGEDSCWRLEWDIDATDLSDATIQALQQREDRGWMDKMSPEIQADRWESNWG